MEHVESGIEPVGLASDSLGGVLGLFDLLTGTPGRRERIGEAHTLQLAARALGGSLVLVALYGAAAGCTDPMLIWQNPLKLPMVVVLAMACSLPMGGLAWKLIGRGTRLSDLVISVTSGVFTATVVLACAAPLIALYYLTTEHVGGVLVTVFCALGAGLGLTNGLRSAFARRPEGVGLAAVAIPQVVTAIAMLAALLQLVHLASPIIPERTVWDGGVEQMMRSAP